MKSTSSYGTTFTAFSNSAVSISFLIQICYLMQIKRPMETHYLPFSKREQPKSIRRFDSYPTCRPYSLLSSHPLWQVTIGLPLLFLPIIFKSTLACLPLCISISSLLVFLFGPNRSKQMAALQRHGLLEISSHWGLCCHCGLMLALGDQLVFSLTG